MWNITQKLAFLAAPLFGIAKLISLLRRRQRLYSRALRVTIAGAGFSGIGMAIRLQQQFGPNVVLKIFERNEQVGGVWLQNTYPGCACDVPSHLYSYSFEPKCDWKRKYADQADILEYIIACTKKHHLMEKIAFQTEVVMAKYDESTCEWQITTKQKESGVEETHIADIFISAVGFIIDPAIPSIPGLDRFEGVTFHSAQWNHERDLTGRKVAVVGSAASAIQIIPSIADTVKDLYVFQRSPNWIIPRTDYFYSCWALRLFHSFDFVRRVYRWLLYWQAEISFLIMIPGNWLALRMKKEWEKFIRCEIKGAPVDPSQVIPTFEPGCKRILISSTYLATFRKPNVHLVCSGIKQVTSNALVTSDDQRVEVDTVIFATGFQLGKFLLSSTRVFGRNSCDLMDRWGNRPSAYNGMVVPKFPNFFILFGPNTALGHNSIIFMIECQINYILQLLQTMLNQNIKSIEIREEVFEKYETELRIALQDTVWSAPSCKSWYKNDAGIVFANTAWSTARYWWVTRKAKLAEYLCV